MITDTEKLFKRKTSSLRYYDNNKEAIKARSTEYNNSHRERTAELWKLRYEAMKTDPVAYEAYRAKRRLCKAKSYLKKKGCMPPERKATVPKERRKKSVIPEFEGPLEVKIIDKNPPRIFESKIKIFTGEFTMTF
jgi:hypothetical protein